MSLVKIPLILASALANHITMISPTGQPTASELAKDITWSERMFLKTVRTLPILSDIVVWISSGCEIAVILAMKNPSSPIAARILRTLAWGAARAGQRIGITRTYAVGCAFAVIGGLLRIYCYRTLGRLFTFEITIRPGHRLVTEGPYSVVRHPAYTATTIVSIGLALCQGGRGSWVRESGMLNKIWGKAVAYGWSTWMVYCVIMLCMRPPQEDKMLRKQFGEQWDNWAAKVPYRLLPGIY